MRGGRGKTPLYEILQQKPAAGGAAPGRTRKKRIRSERQPLQLKGKLLGGLQPMVDKVEPIWDAIRQPLGIEVNRLMAGLAGAVVLTAMVAAFLLGRGTADPEPVAAQPVDTRTATRDAVLAYLESQDTVTGRTSAGTPRASGSESESALMAMGATGANLTLEEAPGGASRIDPPRTDPRQNGLNYLAIVTTQPDEARRIQRFFADHGVATIITPPHNGGLVQVIDVSRGFTREQYRSGEQADHRTSRLALGRAWKRHNNGIGDDLSRMYYSKYSAD
jgi:hypothetical protein